MPFIPHSPESLEDEQRVGRHDIKDTRIDRKRGKYVPVEELSVEELSDEDQDYGDNERETSWEHHLNDQEIEEEESNFYGESKLRFLLEIAEDSAADIKNPNLKKIAKKILFDAEKTISLMEEDEKDFNIYTERDEKDKDKRGDISVAHIIPKGWTLKPFDRYFMDIFSDYQQAIKEVKKMDIEEIRFIFEYIYENLAGELFVKSDFEFFKQRFHLKEREDYQRMAELRRIEEEKRKEDEKKSWQEIKDKHKFELKDIKSLPNFIISSLIDYLNIEKNAMAAFGLMMSQKREMGEEDEMYKALRSDWKLYKSLLKTFELKKDIEFDKIKANTTPGFIRKFNLGKLNYDHIRFLKKILQDDLDKKTKWQEREIQQLRKAA